MKAAAQHGSAAASWGQAQPHGPGTCSLQAAPRVPPKQQRLQHHSTPACSTNPATFSAEIAAAATAGSSSSSPPNSFPRHASHRTDTSRPVSISRWDPVVPLDGFPRAPNSRQQLLCEQLQLTASDAQLLLMSSTAASSLPVADLASNWAQLQQLLPVSKPQLLQAMLQLPDLLARPQEVVTARLADAATTLGLPMSKLRSRRADQTAQLHWQLLVLTQPELIAQLSQLLQVLEGLQRRQVVALVCAHPRLLVVDGAQLLSSIEALEQVCGWQLVRLFPQLLRDPKLLVTPAERLYKAAAGLQQLLKLSEEGLALVVRRAAAALLLPTARFRQLLDELAAYLCVNEDVAADILLQEPELLLRSPGAMASVLGVLRSTFKLGPEALLQVVQFDPYALCFPPGQLAEGTRQFKQLAGSCKAWAAEYKQLMSRPANVARALRLEPLRLQRLVFLSRQRMTATISLRAALTLSGRKFVMLYPRYRDWLAHEYSAGPPPRRYDIQGGRGAGYDSDEDY